MSGPASTIFASKLNYTRTEDRITCNWVSDVREIGVRCLSVCFAKGMISDPVPRRDTEHGMILLSLLPLAVLCIHSHR